MEQRQEFIAAAIAKQHPHRFVGHRRGGGACPGTARATTDRGDGAARRLRWPGRTMKRVTFNEMRGSTVLGAALAACGGSTGGNMLAPDAAAADAQQMVCGASEFPWTTTIHDGTSNGPALSGVHVCMTSGTATSCADTAIDGKWQFCAPNDSEITVSLEKAGYMPGLSPITTGTSQPPEGRDFSILPVTTACPNTWAKMNLDCPPTTGGLLFLAARDSVETGIAGVVIDGASPPAAKTGYGSPSGEVDSTLTASTTNGNIYMGTFPTADVVVTLHKDMTTSCHGRSLFAWTRSAPGPNMVKVPVRAGFRTYALVTCE